MRIVPARRWRAGSEVQLQAVVGGDEPTSLVEAMDIGSRLVGGQLHHGAASAFVRRRSPTRTEQLPARGWIVRSDPCRLDLRSQGSSPGKARQHAQLHRGDDFAVGDSHQRLVRRIGVDEVERVRVRLQVVLAGGALTGSARRVVRLRSSATGTAPARLTAKARTTFAVASWRCGEDVVQAIAVMSSVCAMSRAGVAGRSRRRRHRAWRDRGCPSTARPARGAPRSTPLDQSARRPSLARGARVVRPGENHPLAPLRCGPFTLTGVLGPPGCEQRMKTSTGARLRTGCLERPWRSAHADPHPGAPRSGQRRRSPWQSTTFTSATAAARAVPSS